jgi:hypothetical protein
MLNVEIGFALGTAVKILLFFIKDCNGKPDLKGNAQNIKIKKAPSFQGANILRQCVFDSFDGFN